jgi:L-histidine N-alpha-methyltransferase
MSARVRVDVLLDPQERRRALLEATAAGLRSTPKRVPTVWLYDERGSQLFDEITRLPEYYPTRCEREILDGRAVEVARLTRAETLVELGSGTSEKTRLLLAALELEGSLRRFVPVDVSEEVLVESAREIAEEHPVLEVHAVVGDFERDLAKVPKRGRTLVAMLGSTIGNFVPEDRMRFLGVVGRCLDAGDALLLGLDLVKDPPRIVAAYNDSAGLSERFQRNALEHLDRELESGFTRAKLAYRAVWDPANEWVDIGFRSETDQIVPVPALDLDVELAEGEPLRMEVSTKFRRDRIERELGEADMELHRWWTDPGDGFAVALAVPRG